MSNDSEATTETLPEAAPTNPAPEPPPAGDAPPHTPTHKHRKPKKHRNIAGGMHWSLTLVLTGTLAFYGLYEHPRQLARVQKDLARLDQRAQTTQQETTATAGRQQELLTRYQDDAGTWRGQIATLTEENRLLQEHLVTLQDKMGSSDTMWKLAEVEYLLQTANHRLQLERDVGTARAALQGADERLQRMSDPRFTELRSILARDIQALSGVPSVDTTGIVMALSAIEDAVADLPLVTHSQFEFAAPDTDAPEVKADEPWLSTFRTAWHDIKQLVVVRRRDKPVEPLMPPDQQALLLDNMRLQLAAARMAVLKADSASFHLQISKVIAWLNAYFDKEHTAVDAMIKSLDDYRELELRPALPDISASLLALRQWKTAHGKNSH